jgi:hypothetical protein
MQQIWKNYAKCKKAIRIICNANFRAHTTPLFKEKKILPLDTLIEYSQIKCMHNFHFKQLPILFAESWRTNAEKILTEFYATPTTFMSLPTESSLLKHCHCTVYSFPLVWNSAPGEKLNPRQHLYLKYLKISCYRLFKSYPILYYT